MKKTPTATTTIRYINNTDKKTTTIRKTALEKLTINTTIYQQHWKKTTTIRKIALQKLTRNTMITEEKIY